MNVLAVDPGYEASAWVLFDGSRILEHAIEPNHALLDRFAYVYGNGAAVNRAFHPSTTVVFEQIESMGMAVGREVMETVFWTGRLYQRAAEHFAGRVERVTRHAVKLHLCHSRRAKDSEVRMALIDRHGATKAAAIGTRRDQGPLYGIKSHEWAALAIAVTWWESQPVSIAVPSGEKASA